MLKYLLALTFLLFPGGDGGLVNLPGGGAAYAQLEPGGWESITWTGNEYVAGIYNGQTIAAKIDFSGPTPRLLYLAHFEGVDAGPTTVVTGPWTCVCHGLKWTARTTISDRFEDEDMRKHDRKLEKLLLRHPKAPDPKPLPPLPTGGPTTGKAPVPDPSGRSKHRTDLNRGEAVMGRRSKLDRRALSREDRGGRLGLGSHDRTTKTIIEHNTAIPK